MGEGERVRYYCVNGKQKLLAKLLRLRHHLFAVIDLRIVYQRSAYFISFGFQERKRHTAADDQGIAFLQKIGDYVQLVRYFRSAQDCHKGTGGIVHGVAQEINLFLHQISYCAGIYKLRHAYVGAVRSVGGSESVVYKKRRTGKPALC